MLECLDLCILMVCTCSRTRRWPDRHWLGEGRARDVSSTAKKDIADLSGSTFAIVFSETGSQKDNSETGVDRRRSNGKSGCNRSKVRSGKRTLPGRTLPERSDRAHSAAIKPSRGGDRSQMINRGGSQVWERRLPMSCRTVAEKT